MFVEKSDAIKSVWMITIKFIYVIVVRDFCSEKLIEQNAYFQNKTYNETDINDKMKSAWSMRTRMKIRVNFGNNKMQWFLYVCRKSHPCDRMPYAYVQF